MTDGNGQGFGKLWDEAILDPLNKEKMFNLGFLMYKLLMGADYKSDKSNEHIIGGFAELLTEAFSKVSDDVLPDLKRSLSYDGAFVEPGIWESPQFRVFPHLLLEESLKKGEAQTLLELLMIAHDLEAYVRPNLLRIVWLAKLSTENPTILYSFSQLKGDGEQGSIGYGIDGMIKWLNSNKSDILSTTEKEELIQFYTSIGTRDIPSSLLSELRNWIVHRDFIMIDGGVIINLHPAESAKRIQATTVQITELRRTTLGLAALLKAFNSMFLASVVSKVGDIAPSFIKPRHRM